MTMQAYLTATCMCGRSSGVPCPTVGDIPAASEAIGWGYDERGFVRCPECREAGAVVRREPEQADLFGAVR